MGFFRNFQVGLSNDIISVVFFLLFDRLRDWNILQFMILFHFNVVNLRLFWNDRWSYNFRHFDFFFLFLCFFNFLLVFHMIFNFFNWLLLFNRNTWRTSFIWTNDLSSFCSFFTSFNLLTCYLDLWNLFFLFIRHCIFLFLLSLYGLDLLFFFFFLSSKFS